MRGVALAALVAFLLVAGCGKSSKPAPAPAAAPTDASTFFKAISAVHEKEQDANGAFERAIQVFLTNGTKTPADIKKAQEDFAAAIPAAKAELKAIKVPDVKGAKKLYEAEQRFLDGEEAPLQAQEMLVKALEESLKGKPLDPTAMAETLTKIEQARKKVKWELQQAYEDFAKEHGLKFKGL